VLVERGIADGRSQNTGCTVLVSERCDFLSSLWTLPRFENSRNVEMTTLAEFARGAYDLFERPQQRARLSMVLQPVANLFPGRIVPNDIGGPQLGEMAADGLHGPAR